jgi:hypothetical protein
MMEVMAAVAADIKAEMTLALYCRRIARISLRMPNQYQGRNMNTRTALLQHRSVPSVLDMEEWW